MSRFPYRIKRRPREGGAALVVTLALLTIASLILVSFVTSTRLDRTATASYGKSIQAEQIAQGSLGLIVGSLQQEMAKDGSVMTSAGVAVYTNITAANLLPQRVGVGTALTNLVKISTNAPFFSTATGGLRASAVNSTTANGTTRSVSLTRWNRPCLVTFTNAASAPFWIYTTRNGPTNAVGLPFGASGSTVNNPAPSNAAYVLGRFAYAIYDEGNLLDITTAGYPSTGSDLSAVDMSRKGPEALAELTEIPGLTQQRAVDALVAWRNKASIASSYTNYLYGTAPTNGFLNVASGDNTFLSRADLISYAQANGITNALPYLTTFSRERNSPSIPAGASPTLNPDFRLLLYKGKPLQRFALSRFKLLDQNPAALSASDKGNISTYFGLVPATGTSDTWRAWQYRAATIGTPQAAINAGRAPDLFELLKAAILNGSLGAYLQDNGVIRSSTSNLTTTTTPYPPEQNVDQQVARLVANMIDQYGASNYPTTIQMGAGTGAISVYGIKSLPYFSELFVKAYYPKRTFNDVTGAQFHLYFQLWNPHGNVIPTVGPSQVRITVNPEALYGFSYVASPGGSSTSVYASATLHSFPTYAINVGPLSAYQDPRLVVNAGDATTYRTGMTTAAGAYGFNSFLLDPPTVNMPVSFNNPAGGVTDFLYIWNQNTTFSLQYLDNDGTWRTYSTFAGYANDGGASGIQFTGVYLGDGASLAANALGTTTVRPFSTRIDQPNLALPKPDPRTFRFRTGWQRALAGMTVNTGLISGVDPGVPLDQSAPGNFPTPLNVGMLYRNNGSGNPIAKDPDNIGRVADGYLSSVANPANPMQSLSSARPILLNRPFRSVGELGYVFRDAPWKSLNFFGTDSGDAALLDLFCLEEAEITAGKVNLNTPHPEVLKALLKGALRDEVGGATPLSEADATQIAGDILAKTKVTPFLNRSELVTQFSTTAVTGTYPSIKTRRESPVRALASSTQTRTWNLMIDLVAQSGRFSRIATGLEQFTVEGERRYWLHVAIDRVTGEIIESRLEPVHE